MLHPSYRHAYRDYFDNCKHITVYSHLSMCDSLHKIIGCCNLLSNSTTKQSFQVLTDRRLTGRLTFNRVLD